jgi:hypothetical protein
MAQQRRRFTQVQFLEERLSEEAARLREQAKPLPHGAERERVLRRAGRNEIAYQRVAAVTGLADT